MYSDELRSFLDIGKLSVVLIVDDDELTRRAVKRLLDEFYTTETAGSGEECLACAAARRPGLILLDLQMPGMDGFETLERLKAEGMGDIPVIFLTGERDARVQADCLAAGAMDYIEKPAHPLILRRRTARALELDAARRHLERELARKSEAIEHLSAQVAGLKDEQLDLIRRAVTDPLTGISNRQGLRIAFDGLGSGGPYFLAMIDMDHFKSVNDTFGHLAGDRFLKDLADTLVTAPGAMAFRFGGDEFCLLFRGVTREDALSACRKIQLGFAACGACSEIKPITLSFGMAEWEAPMTPQELIERADTALYAAKETRNAIKFYSPEENEGEEGEAAACRPRAGDSSPATEKRGSKL